MTAKQNKTKRVDKKTEEAEKKLSQIEAAVSTLNRAKGELKDKQKARLNLLTSAVNGHYEEIDKLSKKAPAEQVTNLALKEINYLIDEVKDLLSQDIIIQRYSVFVAAGDNPELRDVVLVLKQLLQGLRRFDDAIVPKSNKINEAISEAKALREVVIATLSGEDDISSSSTSITRAAKAALAKNWLEEYLPQRFMYEKFEEVDLEEYFRNYDEI